MKIAIYDKWLNSMGGGEKVATVMADVLSHAGHKVDLISNFKIDKTQVETKMGVDLSKVKSVVWYERSYEILSPKTKDYDCFINLSYLDHLPSQAAKSIYYIHFPTPIRSSFLGFIKYETLLPFLKKYLIIPEVHKGIEPLDDVVARGGRWLSGENTIVFSNTPSKFTLKVRLYSEEVSAKSLDTIIFKSPNADVSLVDKRIEHDSNILAFEILITTTNHSPAIVIQTNKELLSKSGLGLVSLTIRNIRYLAWNFIKRYFPRYEMALYGSGSFKVGAGLDTYSLLLSNSKFTSRWTNKYWGRDSKILYPPIDVKEFKPGLKKDIILNVGRFFVGGHSKRQDVLIEAFKELIDGGGASGWELHFVGGIAPGQAHQDYVSELQKAAVGYPVFFHFAVDFNELKKLYTSAKIYWHATGFGSNPKVEPIKLEHFGITPVEAMASGAVPLLYKAGGLIETVDGEESLLWQTVHELAVKTKKFIANKEALRVASKDSVIRAKKYSRSIFASQIKNYVDSK